MALTKWDQQFKDLSAAHFFPHEELCRFLGRTYGQPWFSGARTANMTAGEVGCGAGGNLRALSYWGFDWHGVDLSEQAIELAGTVMNNELRDTTDTIDTRLSVGNALALPWDAESMDLVIDIQCLQHLTNLDHKAAYREIARVLRPGGRFFTVHWAVGDQKELFPAHPELEWGFHRNLFAILVPEELVLCGVSRFSREYDVKGHSAQWHVIDWRKV